MTEILIAIAMLCGQPTKGTLGYFNVTDDRGKTKCQTQLIHCVVNSLPSPVKKRVYTGEMLAECYLKVQP